MRALKVAVSLAVIAQAMVLAPPVRAQGGCGSVCIPLEVIGPERADLPVGRFRFIATTEFAEFDNFRVGDDEVPNPGGAKADIHNTTFILDYGASPKFTLSLLLPYVRKEQTTNMFGKRSAEGIGDVSLFGKIRLTEPDSKTSVVLGLGIKIPTGKFTESKSSPNLEDTRCLRHAAFNMQHM